MDLWEGGSCWMAVHSLGTGANGVVRPSSGQSSQAQAEALITVE